MVAARHAHQRLKWLGKEDAPMLLRYGALPGMWRWGSRSCATAPSSATVAAP